jgi:hypothetical protein
MPNGMNETTPHQTNLCTLNNQEIIQKRTKTMPRANGLRNDLTENDKRHGRHQETNHALFGITC